MTDGRVKVDLARLSGAIDDLQAFDRTIAEELAKLENKIAALHITWSGAAAAKHAAAHAEWREGAQRLVEGISRLGAVSAAAHQDYRSVIEANRARFS